MLCISPSDACGLIRWMLMVNPESRATLDEIANHWWLNWGYQRPLLAESEPAALSGAGSAAASQTGSSTRIADWLRRTTRPLLQSNSKMRCLLRPGGGTGGDATVTRQRSIRRSRKENNVSQSMQDNSGPRPSKGILKKRGSLKKTASEAPPLEEKNTNAIVAPPTAPPPAPPPRKGILKKPPERESGYYSSSPDSSDSAQTPQSLLCPSTPPRRKGILKRHGKFSSGGLQEFGSLDQLAASLPSGRSRPRPSGAVSEDSILSSESFDCLDLPDRPDPITPAGASVSSTMRGSISADNLLDLRENRSPGLRRDYFDMDMTCCRDRVGDSTFSITDCRNVTNVYKLALSKACAS